MVLILSPLAAIATHGPANYVRAAETLAADLAHGHSHDFDGKGPGAHNIADHDHQIVALILGSDDEALIAVPSALRIEATSFSGWERDGPRRPPRSAA